MKVRSFKLSPDPGVGKSKISVVSEGMKGFAVSAGTKQGLLQRDWASGVMLVAAAQEDSHQNQK